MTDMQIFGNKKNHKAYIAGMDQYIDEFIKLNQQNPDEAQRRARASLIHSGVLDENGKQKKQICD